MPILGTAYLFKAHEFIPVFGRVRVGRSLVFLIVLCISLFVNLPFLCWPWCCLPFSDFRQLPTLCHFLSFLMFVGGKSVHVTMTQNTMDSHSVYEDFGNVVF